VSLVSGKHRIEGPQLEGHAPKTRAADRACRPSCPRGRRSPADRAVAEWVVPRRRAARAIAVAKVLTAMRADRAGTVRTEVTLD
jgi:hypothetical protein